MNDQAVCGCRAARNLSVAVGTTDTVILGPNPLRSGVIFSPTSLNRCGVSFGEAAAIGEGLTLYPGTQLPIVTRNQIGSSITQDIHAIFETAGETLGIIEIMDS